MRLSIAFVALLAPIAQAQDKWFYKMDIGPVWMNPFGDYFEGKKRVGAIKGHGDMPHGKFKGHFRHGRTITLDYEVNGTDVLENLAQKDGSVTRSFRFETLGLEVVNGEIYVNSRDQITKLIDLNGEIHLIVH